jgi:glycerol-3-phosphate cytidylyltransferase
MAVTILTYGTFDLLHYGHIRLLSRARALGDRLIVGVSTDSFNALKGKGAQLSFEERCAYLSTLRCVDEVIPEESWEQKADDIRRHGVSSFVMGSDWAGHFDELAALCQVVYLDRTPEISSTLLRDALGALKAAT